MSSTAQHLRLFAGEIFADETHLSVYSAAKSSKTTRLVNQAARVFVPSEKEAKLFGLAHAHASSGERGYNCWHGVGFSLLPDDSLNFVSPSQFDFAIFPVHHA